MAQCKRQGGQPSLDCRSPFGNRQDGLGLGFRGLGVRVEGLGISKPVCLRFLVEAEAPRQVEAVQLLIWRRGLAAASEIIPTVWALGAEGFKDSKLLLSVSCLCLSFADRRRLDGFQILESAQYGSCSQSLLPLCYRNAHFGKVLRSAHAHPAISLFLNQTFHTLTERVMACHHKATATEVLTGGTADQ